MGPGSLVGAAGYLVPGTAHTPRGDFAAWTVLGVAMPLVLYQAAFATLNHASRSHASGDVNADALWGFASTVFWPLTVKLHGWRGWRDT